MALTPPVYPPPPNVGTPLPPRRNRGLIAVIVIILFLCVCCVGAGIVLWNQGDTLVYSICQSSPGVLPESMCQSVGAP